MTTFIGSLPGADVRQPTGPAQIYLGTMSNNDAGKDGTIVTTVNGNATASGYVKGYGLQWNMLPIVSGLRVAQPAHRPDGAQVRQLPLEPGRLPRLQPGHAAQRLCLRRRELGLHPRLDQGGRHVYSAWNMVLDTVGKNLDTMRPWPQNALLTVNTSSKTLNVTPAYYVFRHVSQYVDPGAKVVTTSGSSEAVAFKNPDGTIVAVVYNSGAARNYIVSVAGKRLQFMMPANGWATINWK